MRLFFDFFCLQRVPPFIFYFYRNLQNRPRLKGPPFDFVSALCDFFFENLLKFPKGPPLEFFLLFCKECMFGNQKGSPLLYFSALCDIFRKKNFRKFQVFFSKKNVSRFLSLRYSADFRRSRLVDVFNVTNIPVCVKKPTLVITWHTNQFQCRSGTWRNCRANACRNAVRPGRHSFRRSPRSRAAPGCSARTCAERPHSTRWGSASQTGSRPTPSPLGPLWIFPRPQLGHPCFPKGPEIKLGFVGTYEYCWDSNLGKLVENNSPKTTGRKY